MMMEDLMSLGEWELFEQEINQTTGLNAAAFDADGNRITKFAAWANTLCPLIKGNPGSAQAICSVAHQEMARQAQLTRLAVLAECDAGMLKICVPIFKGEVFVGIAGGCGRMADRDRLESYHISQAIGIPEAQVEELADSIPILTEHEAQAAADFIAARVAEILRAAN